MNEHLSLEQQALKYHTQNRKGKIEVVSTKPCATQHDLSLAYSPGVGFPCLAIQKQVNKAFDYTIKGNLVAVISNGTAVLGLGNLGPLASKPVMEGKGILFKRFADIDVFDIEVDTTDIDIFVQTVEKIACTFGGINLEDIKAPECFEIEKRLKETLDIPVFHDDQHGTAIICSAALLNSLELQNKEIEDIHVVFNGTGAAGIMCAKMFMDFGVQAQHLIMCDSKGVIYQGRTEGINKYKAPFAIDTPLRTLEEAMQGADVFVGCSVAGVVTKSMIASMAPRPIVFAMANPNPEITYEDAVSVRDDLIMATGRSDYPNQVNNVMCFPFIFRGALDVQASAINNEMKQATARAIAQIAKEPVLSSISKAYSGEEFSFGKEYIIPKPFDPRLLYRIAPAVAKAAIDTGVANKSISISTYTEKLKNKLDSSQVLDDLVSKAKKLKPRLVFAEGEEPSIIEAAAGIISQDFAIPILIGCKEKIFTQAKSLHINPEQFEIQSIQNSPSFDTYVQAFYEKRKHKGMTLEKAKELFLQQGTYFGSMLVKDNKAEALLTGVGFTYPQAIRPALQIIGMKKNIKRVYGMYMMLKKDRILFLADTSVNKDNTYEHLSECAILCAEFASKLGIDPKIAMLSFSHLGSVDHPEVEKVRKATAIVKQTAPNLKIMGEVHADDILSESYSKDTFPLLGGPANILIFPNLDSGNITYKIMKELGGFIAIGPFLIGMEKTASVFATSPTLYDIINLAILTAAESQPSPPSL